MISKIFYITIGFFENIFTPKKNIKINEDEKLDFDDYLKKKTIKSGKSHFGTCPYCKKTGISINIEKGKYHWYRCLKSGTIRMLEGYFMFNYPRRK